MSKRLAIIFFIGLLILGGCAKAKDESNSKGQVAKEEPAVKVNQNHPAATVYTEKGNIVLELYPDYAPKTVANFIKLSKKGFYNNLTFHRVEPDFVIQGGDPKGNGEGGPGYTIPAEFNSLTHKKGALAMARRADDINSAGSQFYITLKDVPELDGQYTVFGYVIKGMDVVEKISVGDIIKKITIQEK